MGWRWDTHPQHTQPDAPSKGLETGQLEGDRRLSPQMAVLLRASLSFVPGIQPFTSFLVRKGGGEQGAWVGTRQDGERKETLKKGKLGQEALNHHGAGIRQEQEASICHPRIRQGQGRRNSEQQTGKGRCGRWVTRLSLTVSFGQFRFMSKSSLSQAQRGSMTN